MDKREIKKAEGLMRTLAKQQWGDVNSSSKLMEGAFKFNCSGHGGYIVDIRLFPDCADHKEHVYRHPHKAAYYPSKQHFAVFEEDCGWTALFWRHPEIFQAEYEKERKAALACLKKYPTFEAYFEAFKDKHAPIIYRGESREAKVLEDLLFFYRLQTNHRFVKSYPSWESWRDRLSEIASKSDAETA